MIAKAKSVAYTFNSLNYAQNKENAKELDRNLLAGETPGELTNEFLIFQKLRSRMEKNTFSFVLSPDDKDSKNMTKGEWKEITRDFLSRMALDERQWIAYKHNDNGHNHIHIYVNRIDENGNAAKDNFISNKASRVAEQIARERNMKTAKQKEQQNRKETEKRYSAVYHAHKKALGQCKGDIVAYANLMQEKGYPPFFKKSNEGKIVGVQFQVNGEIVKGSAIHRSMSGGRIVQAINNKANQTSRNQEKQEVKQSNKHNKESKSTPGFMPSQLNNSQSLSFLSNDEAKDPDEEEEQEKRRKKRKRKGLNL